MFSENKTAIDEIAAALAHEVKNPVSLIRANIDYMELSDNACSYSKNFRVIKRELDKISNIVGDFIQFTKPADKISNDEINIPELLIQMIDDFIAINGGDIEFIINNLANVNELTVEGNSAQINSLFFNVYKNAVEALKDIDGATIKTVLDKKDGNAVISIQDNGIGISDELTNKIGTPFVTTKASGSGLGLSICKSIAKNHNGHIIIGNNAEKGCVVTITLPIKNVG